MLPLFLLACAPTFSDESNLCGTIDRPAWSPPVTAVDVMTIVEGHSACSDTGGSGWIGEVVASPIPDHDQFEATVEPGTYAVEVSTSGDFAGCETVDVADSSTCSGNLVVTVAENSHVDKPNLYLYPTERTEIAVRLPAWRRITESDPRYPVDGWRVTAWPDGQLDTPVGERDYLFYEMNFEVSRFQTYSGWCVRGPLAQIAIESTMDQLGFLPAEINDFSTAWDGEFPQAEWMTVYPQFENLAAVTIDPAPDSFLRAWFFVAPGCRTVEPVVLPDVVRSGFHAAEWGVAFEAPLAAPGVIVRGG